jgi:hypothetical protein
MDTIARMQELLAACHRDVQSVIDVLPKRRAEDYLTWKQRKLLERAVGAAHTACTQAADAMTDPAQDFRAAAQDHERLRELRRVACDIVNKASLAGVQATRLPDLPAKPYRVEPYVRRDLVGRSPEQRMYDREHDCHFCGPNGPCDCWDVPTH